MVRLPRHWLLIVVAAAVAVNLLAAARDSWSSRRHRHRGGIATASAYGPGLWGNPLACGGRLYPGSLVVAHRWLPCGTRLRICRGYRCVHAVVADRGPYVAGRELDLAAAVAYALCRCSPWAWGVRTVAWRTR
jgi:rare lipoprotein A (peptidoglycan hydrolase)